MANVEQKNFSKPDEVREFPKGKLELVNIGGSMVGRAKFRNRDGNGRRRSNLLLKPIVARRRTFNTKYLGVLHVKMDDGKEFDSKAGDIVNISAGHDAWVVGNESVEAVDFQGMVDYAKSK